MSYNKSFENSYHSKFSETGTRLGYMYKSVQQPTRTCIIIKDDAKVPKRTQLLFILQNPCENSIVCHKSLGSAKQSKFGFKAVSNNYSDFKLHCHAVIAK